MLLWLSCFVVLGATGTWLARRYALARRLIDAPGERRSHSVATPRGGGVAIVAAVVIAAIWLAAREPVQAPWLLALAGGTLAVGVVGLVDDHRPLSPLLRMCVHLLASTAFALVLAVQGSPLLALAAFAACVVLVNVWNFMDGINGLAATQALLVALALASASHAVGAAVALALAGACLGFLPFNFPRARIFLGDVGSGALGFAIGALALAQLRDAPAAWATVVLAPSAFVVDAGLTLARRILRRERWWTAHTQHAYQVAARRWGHARVTTGFAAWTAASIMLAQSAAAARFMEAWVMAWYISAALLWRSLQRLEPQVLSR